MDLSLPEGVAPAEELARFKRYLKNESALLKDMHRSGGLGREVCFARAVVIDSIIEHLFEAALQIATTKNFRKRPVMTVVAVGGYGRAELNPQSDIDIQFLCEYRLLS